MAFDFIKDAGESLWDKITGEDADREKAEQIAKFINGLGIDVKDLNVDVDDETVTIKGTTHTQEDREKVILAAGNVKGISEVNDEIKVIPEKEEDKKKDTRVASSSAESRFYTVKKGDTLSEIALEYYGDATKYPKIFEANRPMLKDPDKIYPGQTLRIPQ